MSSKLNFARNSAHRALRELRFTLDMKYFKFRGSDCTATGWSAEESLVLYFSKGQTIAIKYSLWISLCSSAADCFSSRRWPDVKWPHSRTARVHQLRFVLRHQFPQESSSLSQSAPRSVQWWMLPLTYRRPVDTRSTSKTLLLSTLGWLLGVLYWWSSW